MMDGSGYVVTTWGLRVQGYTNSTFKGIGDIRIDATEAPPGTAPGSTVQDFHLGNDGALSVRLSDGTEYIRGRVLLWSVGDPSLLLKVAPRFWALPSSISGLPLPVPPGSPGRGTFAIDQPQYDLTTPRVEVTELEGNPTGITQGLLYPTANTYDLGIQGAGFFILRDPDSNALFGTRAGAFYLDSDGHFINYAGLRLQGYNDSSLSRIGDLILDVPKNIAPGSQTAVLTGFQVGWTGKIREFLSDNSTRICGQVLLQDCRTASQLVKTNFGLCVMDAESPIWTLPTEPGRQNLGWIKEASLEISQCDDEILSIRSTLNFFIQGASQFTGIPTDLAISGSGFFTVRDPALNVYYATRSGSMHIDANGFLVARNGFRLQGLVDAGLSEAGDIVINAAGAPGNPIQSATITSISIDRSGGVTLTLANGNQFIRGQILLQNYRNPRALRLGQDDLYSNVEQAMPIYSNGVPGTSGLGVIWESALEDITYLPVLRLLPQTGVRLLISDLSSIPFVSSTVESSADLVHWNQLGTELDPFFNVGRVEAFDARSGLAGLRFYRVRCAFRNDY
jgi:flagellar hook protein FlgE